MASSADVTARSWYVVRKKTVNWQKCSIFVRCGHLHICLLTGLLGILFCVGGRGTSGTPFKTIECYDARKNGWVQVIEMSTRRRHVGVVAVAGACSWFSVTLSVFTLRCLSSLYVVCRHVRFDLHCLCLLSVVCSIVCVTNCESPVCSIVALTF